MVVLATRAVVAAWPARLGVGRTAGPGDTAPPCPRPPSETTQCLGSRAPLPSLWGPVGAPKASSTLEEAACGRSPGWSAGRAARHRGFPARSPARGRRPGAGRRRASQPLRHLPVRGSAPRARNARRPTAMGGEARSAAAGVQTAVFEGSPAWDSRPMGRRPPASRGEPLRLGLQAPAAARRRLDKPPSPPTRSRLPSQPFLLTSCCPSDRKGPGTGAGEGAALTLFPSGVPCWLAALPTPPRGPGPANCTR